MESANPHTTRPFPVDIVGMGMSATDLTEAHHRLIAKADLLVGGRRHLAELQHQVRETYPVTSDLKGLADLLKARRATQRIVVLASGDPLFYGIGAYLVRTLGRAHVRIYPNLTSVAAAFARIGEPWQDVPVVSLHGRRQAAQLMQALRTADRIAVFTDPDCSPQWVADFLRRNRFHDCRIGVFEGMGGADEQVSWHTCETMGEREFITPNMVILKRDPQARLAHAALHLGMPETGYVHEKGLITKTEIRAVALARLGLLPQQVLWDLGAGSGAVSCEASLLMPGGRIWAVEKNPARIRQIRANRERWGIFNLTVVEAILPGGLAQLPDPDRVFIGGAGQALAETIDLVCQRLRHNGVLVVNTVLMDSLHATVGQLRSKGWDSDVVQVQVSRSRPLAQSDRLQAMNPVWIIRGHRPRAV